MTQRGKLHLITMNDQIEQAVKILNKGGIIIYPTDTAFGIGCRIDNKQAIEKLFRIRKRPLSQATPVLVNGVEMAQKYLKPIPDKVLEDLIKPYWPGALTIVLPCITEKVPTLTRGGGNTLGVRMPNNETILEIISRVGVPILGPSANFHQDPTPYTYEDLNPEFKQLADFVVLGECITKESSTVVDCSKDDWKILRNGAVELNI